jgi:hypothetical protein
LQELLVKERDFHRVVSKAAIFGFLAEAPDAAKYLSLLVAASEIGKYTFLRRNANPLLLERQKKSCPVC